MPGDITAALGLPLDQPGLLYTMGSTANLPQGLPFTRVVHKVVTRDAQPGSSTVASILVLVTGQLIVDDGSNILQFSQMFHVSTARARELG